MKDSLAYRFHALRAMARRAHEANLKVTPSERHACGIENRTPDIDLRDVGVHIKA
jgi:hypothetical protein